MNLFSPELTPPTGEEKPSPCSLKAFPSKNFLKSLRPVAIPAQFSPIALPRKIEEVRLLDTHNTVNLNEITVAIPHLLFAGEHPNMVFSLEVRHTANATYPFRPKANNLSVSLNVLQYLGANDGIEVALVLLLQPRIAHPEPVTALPFP